MSDFPGVPDIDTRGGGEPAEIVDGSEAVIDADVVDAEIVLDATAREMGGYSSCEEALDDAVSSLERVTAERDDYLDTARRVQAEFENYRKRVESQRADQVARAAESIVVEILPVLDACEAALSHGASDVEPIHSTLVGTLSKQGLARVDQVGVPFDPTMHEAVLSEPAADGDDGPVISEVMRTGYVWNGRVVRPAMVKVRG